MTSQGTVRIWHPEKGWGVIDSSATPDGCWAHYSAVLVAGYRALVTGQAVTFTFEDADQDGYVFRAVEVWPTDQQPVHSDGVASGWSTLTLTFDDGEGERDSS